MIRVRVCNDDYQHPAFSVGGATCFVEGAEDSSFKSALEASMGKIRDGSFSVIIGDPDLYIPIAIDTEVTFAQVARFVDGESLHVDAHERGGDWVTTLWEVTNAGLTLMGLWEAGVKIRDAAMAKRFASERRAAREWIEDGCPEQPQLVLVQHVKAERDWTLERFGQVFGMGIEQSVQLLRALNYRRQLIAGVVLWQDQDH